MQVSDISPALSVRLLLGLSAIVALCALYYALVGAWSVVAGATIAILPLGYLGWQLDRRRAWPARGVLRLASLVVSLGAVSAVARLDASGLLWLVPLTLINVILTGTAWGAATSAAAAVAGILLGGHHSEPAVFVNVAGALGACLVMAIGTGEGVAVGFRELRRQASRDSLTGLLNRGEFDKHIAAALARSAADGEPTALALLDLDHFKAFNDRHGHQAGDAVLRGFATLIRRSIRHGDRLYRYGGEEFALILPATDAAGACRLAGKLQHRLRDHDFSVTETITLSAGVADYRPGDSPETLFRRADAALYAAKAAGRDRTFVSAPDGCHPASEVGGRPHAVAP